jgi:hypothetical protein
MGRETFHREGWGKLQVGSAHYTRWAVAACVAQLAPRTPRHPFSHLLQHIAQASSTTLARTSHTTHALLRKAKGGGAWL